jgi:hypothetical protein
VDMADPLTILAVAGAVAGLGGTLMSAGAAQAQGEAEQQSRMLEARAMERKANEDTAASQREGIRRSREASLVASRQQALAAASGGSATDKTVLDLMSGTAEEGAYQSQSALYEGQSRAAGLRSQADISRFQGDQARRAGRSRANATILSGISNFASGTARAFG